MDAVSPWLAAIVESSNDAIVSKTMAGIVTSWNAGAERLFGYSAQEMLGQPITRLFPADRLDEEPRILARLARGERVEHFETVRLRKDGTPVEVSVTISPVLDSQGLIIGASKIARDIGESKRAERRLRDQLARLHMLDEVTRRIGEHQDPRSISQATLRLLEERMPLDLACLIEVDADRLEIAHVGVRNAALAASLPAGARADADDASPMARCLAGRLVYLRETLGAEAPLAAHLAAGGVRAVVLSPLAIDDEVTGVLVAGRAAPDAFNSNDCEFLRQLSTHVALAVRHAGLHTALRAAYDDLRRTQQAVLRHERLRALGQMASGVAHDINNVVFPAGVYAKGLLQGETGLSASGRRELEHVVRALDDVAATVGRLREFYRSRDTDESRERLDLGPLVEQVLAMARPRAMDLARRGIRVALEASVDAAAPRVSGSASEIREALLNLVINAMDAASDGGRVCVRLRASRAASATGDPQEAVELSVSDDGAGMDAETRRRCLDPFFTTKGERGTGMGLAMVYGTAQRHRAELAIDSAPGRGTTVTLHFPALPDAPMPATTTEAPDDAPPPRSLRVLLVDDDPLVLEIVGHMLRAAGHEAVPTQGGQAGIDAFDADAQAFDAVVTDLGMPSVDGHAVAAAIKRRSPGTPVVLLTGWGEGLLSDGALPPEVDLVIGKPPRLAELRKAMARLGRAPSRE